MRTARQLKLTGRGSPSRGEKEIVNATIPREQSPEYDDKGDAKKMTPLVQVGREVRSFAFDPVFYGLRGRFCGCDDRARTGL